MKTLGQRIDELYEFDASIEKAEKVVRDLKRSRALLEGKLLQKFKREDIDGCRGKRGAARVLIARFPSIKDRSKFDKYVFKHRALDLFQNRISARAYQARLDEGEAVPGVSVYERTSISIRKRGAK